MGCFDDSPAVRVLAMQADLLAGASFNLVDFGFQQHFDSASWNNSKSAAPTAACGM